MIPILISIKDYSKKFNITDAGVRKKIKDKKLSSVKYNDKDYVVLESNEIDKLKINIKLKNAKIKEFVKEKLLYTRQDELIEKLENKIEKLENKLEVTQEKKEELYEKVISHMTQLTYKPNEN